MTRTKIQEEYINIVFNNFRDKITKSTTDGKIFKICRDFLMELNNAGVQMDSNEGASFYLEMKKVRDNK